MNIKDIIISPVLTEKATDLAKINVYLFKVNLKASKSQIKDLIEKIYQVKVESINLTIRKGKKKRVGRRMLTKKSPDEKIAYVKLKEGKIDIFPQT
ncbi:MAG: 50S ribosomal protein L23 [Microgenomates group bacterium]